MGLPVLVLGQSGTGKSTSLRNFKNDEVAVINVAGKPLPFKNKIPSETTDDYSKIKGHLKALAKQGCKAIVIDDAQYLMANEFMRRATERGFDKFTEIAKNFWELVNDVKNLPSDVIVYFMAHIERDADGNEKIKTIGKLLDEKITVEGMFTIVLKTNVTDGVYSFLTQNNGHDTTKSPIGMFPSYAIDNDLHYVDEKIRNYYEMGEFLSDEEIAEIDKEAAKVDFEPKQEGEKKSRRSRRSADENTDTTSNKSTDEEKSVEQPAEQSTEQPRRRRRVSEDPERAAVKAENDEAVANAGMDEAGDAEEVPFEEVKEPETKEMPRRKRRGADTADLPSQNDVSDVSDKTATAQTTSSDPVSEEAATPRRRRRR